VKHSFATLFQRAGGGDKDKDKALKAQLADLLEKVCMCINGRTENVLLLAVSQIRKLYQQQVYGLREEDGT
jgi:hypothetical protein